MPPGGVGFAGGRRHLVGARARAGARRPTPRSVPTAGRLDRGRLGSVVRQQQVHAPRAGLGSPSDLDPDVRTSLTTPPNGAGSMATRGGKWSSATGSVAKGCRDRRPRGRRSRTGRSPSGRTSAAAPGPSLAGRQHQVGRSPRTHGERPAGQLALDQLGGAGDLVGHGRRGDRQLVAVAVGAPGEVVERPTSPAAPMAMSVWPVAPGPPGGVGDDDRRRWRRCARATAGRGAAGRGVRVDGQQQHVARRDVGGVDAGGGQDEPEPVCDDDRVGPRRATHPDGLGRRSRRRRGRPATTRPSALLTTLLVTSDDVAVREGRPRRAASGREVVAGADLRQAPSRRRSGRSEAGSRRRARPGQRDAPSRRSRRGRSSAAVRRARRPSPPRATGDAGRRRPCRPASRRGRRRCDRAP